MKKLLIIFTCIVFAFVLNAQNPGDVEFPSVPGHNGNQKNPVSLNTGAVSQYIPIWQASQDDLNIPVFLSYNSNGIKVSEVSGIAGLTWNLVIGGSVIVEQRGLYDLDYSGLPELGSGFSTSGDLVDDIPISLEFLMNSVHGEYNEFSDTEPDIFHYNFPGSSGKFVFNNNGEIVSLTDKSLKIDYNSVQSDPLNDEITIINSKGIKYFFICKSYTIFENGAQYHSPVFSLYKVENLNTGNLIEIEFYNEGAGFFNTLHTYRKSVYECDGTTEENDDGLITQELIKGLYPVKSIKTKTSEILFTYDEDTYLIDKITISLIKNNDFKVFKEYRFLISSNNLLNELTICYNENFLNNDDNVLWVTKDNPYTFSYTNSIFPDDPEKHDYWGYKNNIYNNLSVFSTFTPDASKILNLQKITYPNRSSTEYEFELNEFSLINIGGFEEWNGGNSGAGLRVSKIINADEDNNEIISEYDYTGGKLTAYPNLLNEFSYLVYVGGNSTYGHLNSYSSVPFTLNSSLVQYSRVIEYKGGKELGTNKGKNGKVEYTFLNEDSYEYDNTNNPNLTELFTGTSSDNPRYINSYNGRSRCFQYNFPYHLLYSKSDINGLLLKTSVFDNQNIRLSETDNIYDITENTASTGLKIHDFFWYICFGDNPTPLDCYDETRYTQYYGLAFYKILQHKIKLVETKNKVYKKGDEDIFTENITTFDYAEDNHGNLIINSPVSKEETLSSGDTVRTDYFYPHDFEGQNNVIDEMLNRNIKSLVLKTETYKNNELLSGSNTAFRYKETSERQIILPDYSQILEAGNYKTVTWFDKYNDNAKLLQSHGIDEVYNSLITGYNNTLPVATAINAREGEIFHDDFEELETNYSTNSYTGKYSEHISSDNQFAGVHDFDMNELVSDRYTYSAWFNTNTEGVKLVLKEWGKSPWQSYTVPNTNGEWEYHQFTVDINSFTADELRCEVWANGHEALVDNVRFFPADAQMLTTTYKPLIGKTSVTDANGISLYYEYDCFGRLIKIYDQDKNLIKENEYNIATTESFTKFSITTESDVITSGCEVTLIATPDSPPQIYESIEFQWFSDFCDGNLIGTAKEINVIPDSENKTFYLKTCQNDSCSDCTSINLSLEQPQFEADISNITFGASGGTEVIDFNYTGCDQAWDATISDEFPWTNYGWLSYEKDYINDKVIFTCNPATIPETQLMQANIVNPIGQEDISFYVKRIGKLFLDDLVYTVYNEGQNTVIQVFAHAYGGTVAKQHNWTVNGIPSSTHLPRINIINVEGETYNFSCTVNDDSGQSLTKTITVSL